MLRINPILNKNVVRFYNDSVAVIMCKEHYGLIDAHERNAQLTAIYKRFGWDRRGRGRRTLVSYIK